MRPGRKGKKINKLPEREQDICGRLRRARELFGYTQAKFAQKCGMSRDRLASYEQGRAPLRVDVALRVCRRFEISEEWLAAGRGYLQPCLQFNPDDYGGKVRLGALFSEAFDSTFERDVNAQFGKVFGDGRVFLHEDDRPAMFRKLLRFLCEQWISAIPPEYMEDFANAVMRSADRFMLDRKVKHASLSQDDMKRIRALWRVAAALDNRYRESGRRRKGKG